MISLGYFVSKIYILHSKVDRSMLVHCSIMYNLSYLVVRITTELMTRNFVPTQNRYQSCGCDFSVYRTFCVVLDKERVFHMLL